MKGRLLSFALILSVFFVASPRVVLASETDALLNKLVEKKILTVEEAQEVRNEMAQESGPSAKVREADTKDVVKNLPGGSWLNTVKWGGDLRLRHETQFRDPAIMRNRERFRLRYGFTATPVKPLEIGVKMGTGTSGDPLSNNQTFTNTFDKKAIFVDLAYAKYTPWSWFSVTGGKMNNPFKTTDIVWDPDVTPEGVALQLKSPQAIPVLKEWLPVRPFANLGAFPLAELNTTKGHPAVYAYQGGADIDLPFFGMGFQPSVAYYDFQGIKNVLVSNVTTASAGAAGNTTFSSAGTRFAYDYNIVDVLGRLTVPDVIGQPVALIGDWVYNTAYASPDSSVGKIDNRGAWQAGLEVGQVTEKFGSLKGFYYYKRLENNATFGPLTDSDFGAGGTNHHGHIFGAQMGLNKWASLGLKYYKTVEINGTRNHNDTLFADLQFVF